MRLILILCAASVTAAAVYLIADFGGLLAWAETAQRGFQNEMAKAVRALRSGEAGAYVAFFGATAAYGFVHALGPGHGKYLVGGVGVGTSIALPRLLGLAILSSLMQSLWAIVLVYGGFALLAASAQQMTDLAEDVLAPASYGFIACVGLILAWRGVRALRSAPTADHDHAHAHDHADCCHAHGPTPDQIAGVGSIREAAALVFSIAIRPCTGAIFLLVITWQMDLLVAGALAVVFMGLGTAALTSLVAVSSTAARGMAFVSSGAIGGMRLAVPAVQVFAGVLIVLISLGLLQLAL